MKLLYDDFWNDRNKYNETPLMLWIKYRLKEKVPANLYYDNYRTDKDNIEETPLMLWIKYRHN